MTRKTGFYLLFAAILLGAAMRVPGWFTEEDMARWRLFEVDEEQHVAIMMHRYNELAKGAGIDTIRHEYNDRDYNVRGYANLNAALLYAGFSLADDTPTFAEVLRFGRQMSTGYALLLIIVVFIMGRVGGLSPPAAGVAAMLMAACDVNATYSHYALPASGYIFTAYLALLGGFLLIRKASWTGLVLLSVGAGGAIAFKFDVLPMLTGGLLLLCLTWAHYFRKPGLVSGMPGHFLPLGTMLLIAVVSLLWTGWSWEEVDYAFRTLSRLNKDVVPSDNHLRDNLITYPFGVLAGIGLPAFGLAAWSTAGLFRRFFKLEESVFGVKQLSVAYVTLFLLTEFLLRWYMDSTFIRRVNIFMPAVALLAAYALDRLRAKPWLTTLVIAWSVGLGVVGQSHHWFDTRVAARDWANEHLPKPTLVGISGYLMARDMDNWRYYRALDWEYFILHESWYSRYTQSMATPFGIPACCEEVYNCIGQPECDQIQSMVLNQRDDVILHKAFRTWDVFPERLVYHHFFGYYETFLGDVVIYRRVKPKQGILTTS